MTASEIAEVLTLPLSTVSLWLKRIGLGSAHVSTARAAQPLRAAAPGDFLHVDIKQLGRISVLGAGHRVWAPCQPVPAPRQQGRLDRVMTGWSTCT